MDSNKYAMDLEKVEREIQLDNIKEIISKKCEKKYDTHLEFSTRVFEKHAELWIYVVDDHSYFDEIQTICEKLSNDKIWILVNKWSGPWPGASEDLEPKRKEFKERMSKKFKGGGEIEAQPFMELAEFAEFAAKWRVDNAAGNVALVGELGGDITRLINTIERLLANQKRVEGAGMSIPVKLMFKDGEIRERQDGEEFVLFQIGHTLWCHIYKDDFKIQSINCDYVMLIKYQETK